MNSRYKTRKEEIDRLYPKGSASGSAANAKRHHSSHEGKARQERRRREEEKKEEPAAVDFNTGFDHGFENMATLHGRAIGKDEGPAVSSSLAAPEKTA